MTEARTGAEAEGGYSKDYWDIVFEQLRRRWLFRMGLALLVVLYASAIYAPLIANDRPYFLEAISYKDYEAARKQLWVPVTVSLVGKLGQTEEQYLAARTGGSQQTFAESLRAEHDALLQRLGTMRLYLPGEHDARLDAFESEVDAALAAAAAGDREHAMALGAELTSAAKALRDELAPRLPGAGGTGIELEGVVSYPILEAMTSAEVFFMLLWACVLGWPVWNRLVNTVVLGRDRERIRRARRFKVAAVLGLALLGGAVWQARGGGRMTFEAAAFKQPLTDGGIVAVHAVFPLIAFGFAETQLGELYRPPTWKAEAEMDDQGRYVRGQRAPKPDPITGFVPSGRPVEVRYAEPERNATWRHPLGTDNLGRDLLVRCLWGGRVSLAVGLVATLILMAIGVLLGSLMGYYGGWVDVLLSRLLEIVQSFPVFFLILVIVAIRGPSILNIMLIIGLVRWTGVARLARGEFLKLKELDFVVAARALGLSTRRVVFKHILPNAMGPLLVAATFSVAAGILVESTLSYLGFGIQLPVPSWGSLINESKDPAQWWMQVFPGLLIVITVVAYNLVGDGIRDAMDPKMRA